MSAVSIGRIKAEDQGRATTDSEFETYRERHAKERVRIQDEARDKQFRLDQQYLRLLGTLMEKLTRQGELDAALAVREERDRLIVSMKETNETARLTKSEGDLSGEQSPIDRLIPRNSDYVYLCNLSVIGAQADRFAKGDPETWEVDGKKVRKGLLAWAPSEVVFDLTGLKAVSLEGSVGIAPANVNSSMRFEVFGDDTVLWQSGIMTQDPKRPGTSLTENFKIDVSGIKVLKLKVDPLGSNNSDHAIWIDPRLKRSN